MKDQEQPIPISQIPDKPRLIAVAWVEDFRPMGGIELQQKHKLASDIQKYAIEFAEADRRKAFVAGLKAASSYVTEWMEPTDNEANTEYMMWADKNPIT